MKRIYLIRHGQPEFPGGERMCLGTTDLPLSEAGRQQAREMARKLPPVTAVYASALSRAVETARFLEHPVTILPGLGEIYQGLWDGLTFQEIRREYPRLYEARGNNRDLPPPGSEPPAKALARFSQALHQAAAQSPGDLAVVSHRGVMALYLGTLGKTIHKLDYCQVICLTEIDNEIALQEDDDHA